MIQYAANVKGLSAAEMHQEARKRCGCRNQLETQQYSDPSLPITPRLAINHLYLHVNGTAVHANVRLSLTPEVAHCSRHVV